MLLENYLNYMEPLKGSTNFHRWAFLAVLSALLERRVWLDRGRSSIIFPNTYTLLIGNPAVGKSWSASQAISFLEQVKAPNRKPPYIGASKITQAALYFDLKDSLRSVYFHNAQTLWQCPIFIFASELAVNMADFGGGTLTNELIDFYDSKSLTQKTKKRTIGDGNIELSNPSITFLGCTTPEYLQTAARAQLITSGLSSRFIFVMEPNSVEKEYRPIEQDKNLRKLIVDGLNRVYQMRGEMTMIPAAIDLYISYAKECDHLCHQASSAFFANYYGRKPDHICKIAMALAASRMQKEIFPEDITQAKTWLEELEPTMMVAFGLRSIEKDEDFVTQLLSQIPKHPIWVSQKDMLSNLMKQGKFVPVNGAFEAAILGLLKAERIRIKDTEKERLFCQS